MAKEESKKEAPKSASELRREEAIKKADMQLKAEEFKKRVDAFVKEFEPLLMKYKIGLGAQPVFNPSPDAGVGWTVAARPLWFDASQSPEVKAHEKAVQEKEESAIKSS